MYYPPQSREDCVYVGRSNHMIETINFHQRQTRKASSTVVFGPLGCVRRRSDLSHAAPTDPKELVCDELIALYRPKHNVVTPKPANFLKRRSCTPETTEPRESSPSVQ